MEKSIFNSTSQHPKSGKDRMSKEQNHWPYKLIISIININ